jgi:hypothetical protein
MKKSHPVRQPAEEHRAQHRAGQVGAGRQPDVGVAELQDRASLQGAGDCTGERHLQAVEDPGDTQRHDDQGVKPPPRQPVQARRNIGFGNGADVRRGDGAPTPLCNGHAPCSHAAATDGETSGTARRFQLGTIA